MDQYVILNKETGEIEEEKDWLKYVINLDGSVSVVMTGDGEIQIERQDNLLHCGVLEQTQYSRILKNKDKIASQMKESNQKVS